MNNESNPISRTCESSRRASHDMKKGKTFSLRSLKFTRKYTVLHTSRMNLEATDECAARSFRDKSTYASGPKRANRH